MKKDKILPGLGFVTMLVPFIFAGGYSLTLTPVKKAQDGWCWASSCEMVLDYYNKPEDQYDVAGWCVDGENVANYLCGNAYPGHVDWHTCEEFYKDRGVSGECKTYNMTATTEPAFSDFEGSIKQQEHPVHAGIWQGVGWNHHAAFYGAVEEGDEEVLKYIDPDDKKEKELKGWDISNVEGAWLIEEVGVNDRIVIVEDNYYNPDVVHSNEHVHFKCYWHDVNETSWITEIKWEIFFRYNGGTYHYVTNEKHRQNIKEVECPETRRRHDSIQNTCRRSAGRHCGQPGHQGTHYV